MKRKWSKISSLFIFVLLSISLLGGCGQDTKDITVNEEADGQKETEKKEETESKLGSRTNPVPFKKTATVDDELYNDQGESFLIKFDLTVVEVIRGDAAYQKLKSMNEFNEPAPEGYEWALAKTKVKFVESETEDLPFHIDGVMNFTMVSESGDIYSGDIVGTAEPDFSFEMYVGNEKEGYIPGLVKVGEKVQLRYEETLGGQVFFNLQ
ncbi:hypothetical protein ABET41_10455 [Metabacillus fastidiosus]|uniref:DUF4352 domain-containing protein n=1 Tax=Metabacillus fastidiosus TaxID=1458 RepID=A0ABU6NS70_9BACI|nr:hypothetical protein [Metabacillus fastidiosus]MED4399983.1 hypothetical protein [Metabacillus fastidiosus]MED4462467.1 hypothetical protein [Metabacillus fastidiosus]